MIYKTFAKYEGFDEGSVIRYYGDSAVDFLEDSKMYDESFLIGRDCKTEYGIGTIIGIEVNNAILDNYWIVYIPKLNQCHYPLVNDASFYKTLK